MHIPRWTKSHSTLLHDGPYKEFYDPSIAEKINEAISDVEKITNREWIGRAYNGMSWNDTNYLHRGFTTSMITLGLTPFLSKELDDTIATMKHTMNATHFEIAEVISWDDSLTDYYGMADEDPDLYNAFSRINCYIHIYESLFLRSGRAQELDMHPFILDVDLDLKNQDGSLMHKVWEEEIQVEHKGEAFSGYDNNVYALKKILGKDYLTAYFEYDDPTKWDITNGMVSDGGLQIDYNNTYQAVHESPGFQSWATHYGISDTDIYSNYQIGKVINDDVLQALRDEQPDNIDCDRESEGPESATHFVEPSWTVLNIEVIE